MSDVVYTSNVKIERVKGPLRRAFLPKVESPVMFGVHSEIAEHYGVDPQVHDPHATTLDYVVASAAG
ncbi:MAG: hypothetical protein JRF72_21965 [Deltaproteobacteria bacterium]|nr:hypothetical protein [Deltaproteobacteria bacterium]